MEIRAKIAIAGIVQGIGFRPFIYRLAKEKGLKGYIRNDTSGIDIEVEGELDTIESFIKDVELKRPPLALITSIQVSYLPPDDYKEFVIRGSILFEHRKALISPDIAICDDCLRELYTPRNRRFLFPFINCTNCGPRYTIMKDIPYDRDKTTMTCFKMCRLCEEEYHNPNDRRFHAQPNACWDCGPVLKLLDNKGIVMDVKDPIEILVKLLKEGKIVAIKGLGGFHLAADATNDDAVSRLRYRKYREEKPFAIMSYSVEEIEKYAYLTPREKTLLLSPQRPILLLRKKENIPICQQGAPKNKYLGVMLPYTPIHYLIFMLDTQSQPNFIALVMTSGNLSEEPIAIGNRDVLNRLTNIADYFLIHDRDIYLRNDDSVIKLVNSKERLIRRSRGYAPMPIMLKDEHEEILGCGAQLKNTICLTKGRYAFISQHIGDLENYDTLSFFEMTIDHLKRILQIEPHIIAHDLHPEYLSAKWALEQKGVEEKRGKATEIIGVQHHHAHIAGCMAEYGLDEDVIGLAMDGAGYGLDGNIWGGEVIIANLAYFERYAHFEYVPMPGGEKAIKEPWRMAICYIYHTFGKDLTPLELLPSIGIAKIEAILKMIEKRINSPLTSSLGRIFDGISSLLGIRDRVKYEGQAAMELEMIMEEPTDEGFYPFSIMEECQGSTKVELISIKGVIEGIIKDIKNGLAKGIISYKFHNTVVHILLELCKDIRKNRGLSTVVGSGGCFQNTFLLETLEDKLNKEGFRVYFPSRVPVNDGGISLGQAAIANKLMKVRGR